MKLPCALFAAAATATAVVDAKPAHVLRFAATSQGLQEAIAECGQYFGDGSALDLQVGDGSGTCPDNADCTNFYTLQNLLEAIDEYNAGRAVNDQFPAAVSGSRCLTLSAFLAQTWYESGRYRACKERTQPCPSWSQDLCSVGRPEDYAPSEQGNWQPKNVPGSNPPSPGPSAGCTDAWGNRQTNTANCWFGRGALQITWLPNYNRYMPEYINNPDAICEVGVVGWRGSISYWHTNRAVFLGDCESATLVPDPAFCDAACYASRCDQQAKVQEVLRVTAGPAPPPPSSGTHTVTPQEAAGGCWGIMDSVCPGQGNNWAQNLCNPAVVGGACPNIVGGDVITYNCNGCP